MADHDPNCIFCKIARREIPATVVREAPGALAFRDIDPKAPVHILLIPTRHVASLNEAGADPDLLGRLLALISDIAAQEGLAQSGYRVVINTGGDGGQSVAHLHLHLLGGRQMGWPPG